MEKNFLNPPLADKDINKINLFKNKIIEIDELTEKKYYKVYKREKILFNENTKPTGIFYLKQGNVKLSKIDFQNNERIIRLAKKGELLGLNALMKEENYFYTATALNECITCFIPKYEFFNLFINYPQYFSYQLITVLCNLLNEAENRIDSFISKQVRKNC